MWWIFRSKSGPRYGEFRMRHARWPRLANTATPCPVPNQGGQAAGDPGRSRPGRKKTGPALTDPGKCAGGKPATGRLCRTGPEFKGEGPELAHMPHLCDMAVNARRANAFQRSARISL